MKTTYQTIYSLTAGTLHSSQVYQYKTKDGRAVFVFSYEYQPEGYYVIAIHHLPSYQGRDERASVAHWLDECDESPLDKKICFHEGKEPTTLEKAKNISVQWAELTWNYIRTGVTIDEQIIRNN